MFSKTYTIRSIIGCSQFSKTLNPVARNVSFRTYADHSRKSQSFWEKMIAPAGNKTTSFCKGTALGASAVGLAALCYYGSGVESSALQEAHLWPQYVRDRIKTTYAYIAGSLILTATSAIHVSRSPALLNVFARSGFLSVLGTMALMIGSGMFARGIEYTPGFGAKQIAWILHACIMGAVVAPLCFLGGPVLTRAACYTAGVVGGLSALAICAPSGQFLSLRAPLAMGFGAVFAASLASMLLPPTMAFRSGLYTFSVYGGLVVFSGFLLYHTQLIVKTAETHPLVGYRQYDPINLAISVYLDILNVFVNIAMILAGGGGNRRK